MNFFHYLWRLSTTRWQIVLTSLVLVGFLAGVFLSTSKAMALSDMWQNWLELYLTVATILIAIFIWYNEKKQDWENSLPKKLNAYFYYGGKVFYKVENAPLAADNDIRQWGQQIARQMNEGKDLSFNGFNVKGPTRAIDSNGMHVMRYELSVWLQKIGDTKTHKTWRYDNEGALAQEEKVEIQPHLTAASAETEIEREPK